MSRLGGLDEMVSAMESDIKDYTENNECSGCGNCCTRILPISSKEIKRIKRYVEKHGIKEQTHMYPTADPSFDMQCPFRDEIGKRCTIYPVRPAVCQDFRCDMPSKEMQRNKKVYDGKYTPVDMRAVFYGRESVSAMMLRVICDG